MERERERDRERETERDRERETERENENSLKTFSHAKFVSKMLSKRGRWQKPLKTNFEQFMANLIGLNGLKKKLPLTQNLNKSDTYKKCFERESIERICN